MSDDKVLSAIDLAESECRAWLGEVAVNGSVSGAANARMHRMFQAIRDSLVERAGEPVAYQVSDGYAKVPRKISEQDADIIGMPVAWYERAVATAERLGNPTAYTLPPTAPGASHER